MNEDTYNEIVKQEASKLIKKHYIWYNDYIQIYYKFDGSKFKYKNYEDAIFDCIMMIKDEAYKKFKRTKLSTFFKQLFCKHEYVCEKIIIPKGYNDRVHFYYLTCLKCGKEHIHKRID